MSSNVYVLSYLAIAGVQQKYFPTTVFSTFLLLKTSPKFCLLDLIPKRENARDVTESFYHSPPPPAFKKYLSIQGHYFHFVFAFHIHTKLLTAIGAGDLGKDAERAGLGRACPGVPVFGVFNQSLLAGIAVGGCVVKLCIGIHNVLPRGAASRGGESREQKASETTWVGVATKTRAEL